jgi:hypothetical protein
MLSSPYSGERYIPFDPDVPEKDRRLADEVSEEYDRRQQAAAEKRNQKLQQIIDQANYEIRNLVGTENWLKLRRVMRDEKIAFRNLLQPPEGLTADYDELNAARIAAVQRFLNGIGVEVDSLRPIYREAADKIDDVLKTLEPPEHMVQPGYHLLTHQEIWDAIPRSQFQIFRPPYPGVQIGFDRFQSSGTRVARNRIDNVAAGLVGHDLTLDCPDATDFDKAWGIAHTQAVFNFRAPATGPVEVVIEAQVGLARHELRTVDEWGVSDSRTIQRNSLMMHVIHPNISGPSFALMSHFIWNTDSSGTVHRQFLNQGHTFFTRLFSDGPVQQNQVVEIRVGTSSVDEFWTNDVEIHSRSLFHWSLRSVAVRIAP